MSGSPVILDGKATGKPLNWESLICVAAHVGTCSTSTNRSVSFPWNAARKPLEGHGLSTKRCQAFHLFTIHTGMAALESKHKSKKSLKFLPLAFGKGRESGEQDGEQGEEERTPWRHSFITNLIDYLAA